MSEYKYKEFRITADSKEEAVDVAVKCSSFQKSIENIMTEFSMKANGKTFDNKKDEVNKMTLSFASDKNEDGIQIIIDFICSVKKDNEHSVIDVRVSFNNRKVFSKTLTGDTLEKKALEDEISKFGSFAYSFTKL